MTVFIVGGDDFLPTQAQLEDLIGGTDDVAVNAAWFEDERTREVGPAERAAMKAAVDGSAVVIDTEEKFETLLKQRGST